MNLAQAISNDRASQLEIAAQWQRHGARCTLNGRAAYEEVLPIINIACRERSQLLCYVHTCQLEARDAYARARRALIKATSL